MSRRGKTSMPITPPTDPEAERRFTLTTIWVTLIAGLAGAILFLAWPELDIILTAPLYENGRFALIGNGFWSFLRDVFMWGFTLFYVSVIAGAIVTHFDRRFFFDLSRGAWLYMIACSLLGPLLVTNVWLKAASGRPRPRQIETFGGDLSFTPVFYSGGECPRNCSFVSGEVSSMVMIFASLMFVSGRYRPLFGILMLAGWAVSGFMRVGQGGHFPSDVYFAGIYMVLVAAALYWLMFLHRGGLFDGRQ